MRNSISIHGEFLKALGVDAGNVVKITSSGVDTVFYTSSGVDIEAGDDFSSVAGKVCKGSYDNSSFVQINDLSKGNFRGPRGFSYLNLPEGYVNTLAPDGIGTKVVLHETLGDIGGLENGAYDIVAMTADDITRYGGVPTVFTSVLDVRSIKEREEEYKQMMLRLGIIAKEQGFVILNGETAELGACVGTPNIEAKTAFNWSGMMSGVYHPDKMIYGDKVEAGDILVALKQDGFRSNGLSAVRKAFALQYGDNWYKDAPRSEILEASAHSVPYARAIAEANGWYSPGFKAPVNISGIAHLSGGSFKGKLLEDMLGVKGLSAEFDNLFPIPDIVKKVAIWSQKSDRPMKSIEELYSTWCAGQGMIVAVKTWEDVEILTKILENNGIESRIAGKVVDTPNTEAPSIIIKNVR